MMQVAISPHGHPVAQGQQGSVVLIVAAVLAILGALLVSVQMGYDYLLEQRLQKAADLAALSAVQVGGETACDSKVGGAAAGVASKNVGDVQTSAACGRWAGRPKPVFVAKQTGTSAEPLNAVQVRVTAGTPSLLPNLFGGSLAEQTNTVSATSAAVVGPPVATFSVGARLLSLRSDGLVANILKPIGLAPQQLSVLSSDGLTNLMVTPSGLLQAMGLPPTVLAGIGTSAQLAKLGQLKLGDLLDAYGTLLDQAKPADLDIGLVKSAFAVIKSRALNVPVELFRQNGVITNLTTAGGNPGGFSDPSTLTSALSTQISLGDLIGSSILAANGQNFVNLDASVVPGLLTLKMQVVAPPTIVTGPVGTTASNVQTQFALDLDLLTLSGVLSASLPISLGVGSSTGEVKAISLENQSATFSGDASTASLCIGILPSGSSCTSTSKPGLVDFVKVLGGLVTLQVGGNVPLAACKDCGSVEIPVRQNGTIGTGTPSPKMTIAVADLQTNVKLLGILNLNLGVILTPLVTLLNGILTPLLQQVVAPLLGANLNETDIHLYGVTRGAPYLVK